MSYKIPHSDRTYGQDEIDDLLNRIARLELALNAFVGFVRGGYAECLPPSYKNTLQIITIDASRILQSEGGCEND